MRIVSNTSMASGSAVVVKGNRIVGSWSRTLKSVRIAGLGTPLSASEKDRFAKTNLKMSIGNENDQVK